MQAVAPVRIHVQRDWQKQATDRKISNQTPRSGVLRMRTRVINKPKVKKPKSTIPIPKPAVVPKLNIPPRSRSSSAERGPWVPPPGRSNKGQKVSWQSPETRLESVSKSQQTPRSDVGSELNAIRSPNPSLNSNYDERLTNDIQVYEKRIQGLIDGVLLLKEQVRSNGDPSKMEQLRTDIDSSLWELEEFQKHNVQNLATPQSSSILRSRSASPKTQPRIIRSSSADERQRRPNSRVSFQENPDVEQRRSRSMTPIRTPLQLNPGREEILTSLADSEADTIRIAKKLSIVKDILAKPKYDHQTESFEIEQLRQHRNELLYLIEQYERSNRNLRDCLRNQYHLEAEHGHDQYQREQLMNRINTLENENKRIHRVLLDRENDNIDLQAELERIRAQTIGFDTMKHSLEHNRAHLQRELYAKEGEIHRLQCALRSLERDLHRPRSQSNRRPTANTTRSSNYNSSLSNYEKSSNTTIERLQAELDERDRRIRELQNMIDDNTKLNSIDNTNEQIIELKSKLEQAERLANEYKAQLNSEVLKNSAHNSRNHLSQIDYEEKRARLQKRLEELEPLPELLKQSEQKQERLQKLVRDLEKRLENSSAMSNTRSSSMDSNLRSLHSKIDTLEKENDRLRQMIAGKNDEKQSRLSNRSTEFSVRDRLSPMVSSDLDQESARLRFDYAQLKREKDDSERRLNAQIKDLREKLDQSNRSYQALQNYLNSLKSTYTALFHDKPGTSSSRLTS